MRKIIAYIVYGDEQSYYDGAKFSFLTFMNWLTDKDLIEIIVLTEKPEKFEAIKTVTFGGRRKRKTKRRRGGKRKTRRKKKRKTRRKSRRKSHKSRRRR